MDFATTDLLLAILHHLLIFALAGVLAFEIAAVRTGMTGTDVRRVARVDLWYGILAGAILIVGFTRVNVAAKGWAYYSVNPFFWMKMLSFGIVGLLSLLPTFALLHWKNQAAAKADFVVADKDVRRVRRILWAEAGFFALILVFAAMMARMS